MRKHQHVFGWAERFYVSEWERFFQLCLAFSGGDSANDGERGAEFGAASDVSVSGERAERATRE